MPTAEYKGGSTSPLDVAVTGDITDLEIVTEDRAYDLIRRRNDERYVEALTDLGDGDQDDFRWLSPAWFFMISTAGTFVASIKYGGGGGRSSYPPDPGDYCNLSIIYDLHYRVE